MLPSKGHIQPHHANLPRRHPRSRLPRTSSRTGGNLDHVAVPRLAEHAPTTTGPVAASTNSTKSTETSTSSGQYIPVLPHTRSFTPVTSPLDPPPEKFALPLPFQRQESVDAAVGPTLPLADDQDPHPPVNVSPDVVKFRFASPSTARGHLEPRATNLPRRFSRAQKEKEIVRRRCLQEFLPASGIWIAFDSRTNAGDDDDEGHKLRGGLTSVEKEHDWMWREEFGFTGVIRVQIGGDHGKHTKSVGKRDILELVIGREEVRAYDDLGIPVLTEDQLNNSATFFVENHRRWNGKGKLLITTPPQRPVEALSIAFFASSLLSTSSSLSPLTRQPPSYLTETRLLLGILELKHSQELDNHVFATDIEVGKCCEMRARLNYTPIHFALWHVHDLGSIDQHDESAGLKLEWRGALSQDGIKKLENLLTLRLTV